MTTTKITVCLLSEGMDGLLRQLVEARAALVLEEDPHDGATLRWRVTRVAKAPPGCTLALPQVGDVLVGADAVGCAAKLVAAAAAEYAARTEEETVVS